MLILFYRSLLVFASKTIGWFGTMKDMKDTRFNWDTSLQDTLGRLLNKQTLQLLNQVLNGT